MSKNKKGILVGQRVRIIKDYSSHKFIIGSVQKVYAVSSSGMAILQPLWKGAVAAVSNNEVIKITEKKKLWDK